MKTPGASCFLWNSFKGYDNNFELPGHGYCGGGEFYTFKTLDIYEGFYLSSEQPSPEVHRRVHAGSHKQALCFTSSIPAPRKNSGKAITWTDPQAGLESSSINNAWFKPSSSDHRHHPSVKNGQAVALTSSHMTAESNLQIRRNAIKAKSGGGKRIPRLSE